jgi:hypothetical protein
VHQQCPKAGVGGKIRTLQYLDPQNPGANPKSPCKRPKNGFKPSFDIPLTQKNCPKIDFPKNPKNLISSPTPIIVNIYFI